MAISAHCIPCEQSNCWIEIDVRDEQNRSFKGQKATLTDAAGKTQTVTLKDGPTLVQGFAVGPVTVKLETQPWLKAAQARERAAIGYEPPTDEQWERLEAQEGLMNLIRKFND